MDFDEINITDIVPADYNPRKINESDYNYLKNSISEFGLVDPIIINLKNNMIIGGHQRYDVLMDEYVSKKDNDVTLKLFKLGEVGWCFTDTDLKVKDENHEKALNVALNKIQGDWDNPKLLNLLDEIDSDVFDVNLIGFTDDEEDIIKFKVEEEDVDKYASGDIKKSNADNAVFRVGLYKFSIPFEEYAVWKKELVKEAEDKGVDVEFLLLEKLGLKFNLNNELPEDDVDGED